MLFVYITLTAACYERFYWLDLCCCCMLLASIALHLSVAISSASDLICNAYVRHAHDANRSQSSCSFPDLKLVPAPLSGRQAMDVLRRCVCGCWRTRTARIAVVRGRKGLPSPKRKNYANGVCPTSMFVPRPLSIRVVS